MDDIGAILQGNGWRQGIILSAKAFDSSLPGDVITDQSSLVVVTQSCDLIHQSLVNEPHAVFLVIEPLESLDNGFRYGKHPRQIHLISDTGKAFSARAWNQVSIPREVLRDIPIEGADSISSDELRVLTDWLAKRYTRIAFPDNFNDLLHSKRNTFQKLIKKHHDLFLEILLYLEPFDELPLDTKYRLICRLLMDDELHSDTTIFRAAEKFAEDLKKLFEECGIDVVEIAPISDEDLSYADLKQLARWDYDYLSNRELS